MPSHRILREELQMLYRHMTPGQLAYVLDGEVTLAELEFQLADLHRYTGSSYCQSTAAQSVQAKIDQLKATHV
jgi:hypothetical protein